MRLSLHVQADSPLHRLDPRVKVAALLPFTVSQLLFDDPLFLCGPFAGLLLLAVLGRVLKPYLIATALVVFVGGFSFLMWPLVLRMQGQTGTGPWIYGLGMGLRLTNILLAGILILLVTRIEEMLAAFAALGVPFPAVFALGLTFRLLPAILETANHVVEAQKLRGLRFDEGGPVTRVRRYVPLLIPILAGTLSRAHRMAWALDAKGFGSPRPRSPYLTFRMRPADWGTVALIAAGLAGAILLRVRGIGYRGLRGT